VVDTLNDLDNVLYEITNESPAESKDWQYHMVSYLKAYQAKKPKQHPVGMTYFYGGRKGAMEALLAGPADWISPGNDGGLYRFDFNPPVAVGKKVIISDTDHFFGIGGDRDWVWKSFTRGLNPIYMDPYGNPNFSADTLARHAMGQTLNYAKRMDLAAMSPRPDLCSTSYCLANPGREYLVYVPRGSHRLNSWITALPYGVESWLRSSYESHVIMELPSTVERLRIEWLNPTTGEITAGGAITGAAQRHLVAPFRGDAVLYLYPFRR
jgi:hypothetical protein